MTTGVAANSALNEADDSIRANTYALLGRLLAAPADIELLQRLTQIEEPKQKTGVTAAWFMLKQAAERASKEALEDEYHALFIGLGQGEMVPFGSWYLTGFLMEKPLALLRRDLAALGFERQENVHEPEDHAAALCETMSLIITSDEDIPFDTQQAFFSNHLASWMHKFFRDLQQAESAHFYRAVGHLGEQFLNIERQYLAMLT